MLRREAPINRVVLSLTLTALVIWLWLPLGSIAPNRIMPGTAYPLAQAVGWPLAMVSCLPLLGLLAVAWRPTRSGYRVALALTLLMLAALPSWLALMAQQHLDPELPQARVGIGAAWWLMLFWLSLLLIELRTRLALAGWQLTLSFVPVLAGWWLAGKGLESLALRQELEGRGEAFGEALIQHLLLVGGAVGMSLLLGAAIALAMRQSPRVERLGFALLNFLQTIPSLALFGLLLAPLAWLSARVDWLSALGVSGIGWAPAFLALLGYSLLPMVRNTFVALSGVEPGVLEAARGMGMSRGQVFRQVRLPLALPVVLEGVRITTVQAIGLTAVAALIGAGGLGTFIFQGLGQAAMDLVLLGAMPILVMALAVDALLGALTRRLDHRSGQTTGTIG
ncbi:MULTISPECIES: ABC transporter permease [unclassified Halomonas]|uniref:ABC transporter permease n=1 Tax=unclassified Halomonas TaxID=2609666 RepID=UPI0028886BDC|nr:MULTISPECIES: ABC transporter permease [unclassified Halomonas]MDT0500444.1 ABC transporter permease [Halomonas sp. PAR7]MDT0511659.1 ABC transporter permease [Halomonas sp. LES1]MDT0590053.1 ABC transporter permease [Halomonas sp. PAR8]